MTKRPPRPILGYRIAVADRDAHPHRAPSWGHRDWLRVVVPTWGTVPDVLLVGWLGRERRDDGEGLALPRTAGLGRLFRMRRTAERECRQWRGAWWVRIVRVVSTTRPRP